jgi:perosamine synthetase
MESMTRVPLYAPELPTLPPATLLAPPRRVEFPPFDSDNVHWFYFARNAVWNAVKMLGLDGGEVLVPSYHHGVEIETLVHAGVRPVFYRVGSRWDVDLDDVAARIGPHTRALYLTHFAGFPGPVREMKALAEQHGLALIEDCALSLLSSDGELKLGTVGDVGVFCLYKTLPVPNGGALVINGPRRFQLPRLQPPPTASVVSHTASALLKNIELRGGRPGRWVRASLRGLAHGAVRAGKLERVATGTMHFNPDHLDLGISPLSLRIAGTQDCAAIIRRRRRNYETLLAELASLSPPLMQELPQGTCPLFYPMRVTRKQAMLERLRAQGIEAVDFWGQAHPACDPAEFPETMLLRNSIVELPCHQDLDDAAMQRIAIIVQRALHELEPPPRACRRQQPRMTTQ